MCGVYVLSVTKRDAILTIIGLEKNLINARKNDLNIAGTFNIYPNDKYLCLRSVRNYSLNKVGFTIIIGIGFMILIYLYYVFNSITRFNQILPQQSFTFKVGMNGI